MLRDNVIYFEQTAGDGRRRVTGGKVKELVAQCRALTAETLPRLLQDLFENLDDDLYEFADKSTSDTLQTRYFDAMRELRKLRGAIEQTFFEAALGTFDNFWEGIGSAESFPSIPDEDELSLVAEEDLEQDLAVRNVVSKAENRYHRALYALNQRFALMSGGAEVSDQQNPVGPAALTNSFRRALERWDGDLEVDLVIYKLFDRHVMQYVGGLYDDLNELLVAADILPKVAQRSRRNPVAPSVQRARDPAHTEPDTPELTGEDTAGDRLMSLLSQLLSSRRAVQGGIPAAHLPVVPAREVLTTLTDLQSSVLSTVPVSLEEAQAAQEGIRVRLMERLGVGTGADATRRFERAEQDVIDVISMLFEYILDDRNLPDPMKALLSRLQIPMLKVALVDRKFFASRNHPARRLLNTLARAAVAWVDDGDRSPRTLYGQVEAVVNRILTEFVDDVGLFEELEAAFAAYLESEARGAVVAEERIKQVNRGQEQLKLARDQVSEAIESRVAAVEVVPMALRDLLLDGWKDVLLLALLREGEDSAAWRQGLELVDQLLWSVQPKAEQAERQQLLKVIPEMLRSVREGLDNISYDQHRAAQLFKELQVSHIAALRGASVTPVETPISEPEEEVSVEEAMPAEPARAEVEADEHVTMARALPVGQWLEWEEGERRLRGKLSWKSEVTGTYVFVSRKGTKVAEMTTHDVAALFRSGCAKPLDQVGTPLMDRALDAMLEALRKTGGGGPADPSALPA